MNKAVLVAILGLVAFTSAMDSIEITPMHFFKAGALSSPISLAKSMVRPSLKDNVVWGTCPSSNKFKTDSSNTYNKPQPPVKGTNVQLFLAGTFLDDCDLAGLKVYVTWNNNPLYVNDFPRSAHYDEGTPYKDNIQWLIPSFAPSGHYHVELTLHDSQGTPENFACLTADFNL
jgi:hypothetical protein